MHAHPVLRLILEPPDNRGISRLDFPHDHAFPRGLSFDRRQQGPVIKLVRHAIKLGAHISIMNELQVFHDEFRSTSLRPLHGLDRETSHPRIALGRSDIVETRVAQGGKDNNGSGRLHEYHVPTYIATRATRR